MIDRNRSIPICLSSDWFESKLEACVGCELIPFVGMSASQGEKSAIKLTRQSYTQEFIKLIRDSLLIDQGVSGPNDAFYGRTEFFHELCRRKLFESFMLINTLMRWRFNSFRFHSLALNKRLWCFVNNSRPETPSRDTKELSREHEPLHVVLCCS